MQELKKKKEEDAKLMPPPSLPGMEAPDDRTPNQKKKDQKLLSKIIKPKGWNKNWSKGEQSNQVGIPGPYGRLHIRTGDQRNENGRSKKALTQDRPLC